MRTGLGRAIGALAAVAAVAVAVTVPAWAATAAPLGTPAWHSLPGGKMPDRPGIYPGGSVVVGGDFYTGDTGTLGQFVDSMQWYDFSTRTWTVDQTPIPTPTSEAAWCADPSTGLIYVVDGVNPQQPQKLLQVYDTSTHTWTTGPAPPFFRQDEGCGFVGGTMYVFGGYDGQRPTNTTFAFDPSTGGWSKTPYRMPRSVMWSAYLTDGGTIVDVGGAADVAGELCAVGYVQAFTPGGGWHSLPSLPAGLIGPGAAVDAGHLTVFGGGTRCSNTARSQTLSLVGGDWVRGPALPGARVFMAYGTYRGHAVEAGGQDAKFNHRVDGAFLG